jgi:hypothetical protein
MRAGVINKKKEEGGKKERNRREIEKRKKHTFALTFAPCSTRNFIIDGARVTAHCKAELPT